ncbi:Protein LUTEIN DEFICIENT 5 chloroplastic [Bienertia sinuspersici]
MGAYLGRLKIILGYGVDLVTCFALYLVFGYNVPLALRKNLSNLEIYTPFLDFVFKPFEDYEKYSKIPGAKGQIAAICSEAFFFPLYELYHTYDGISRLNFGTKVGFQFLSMLFLIVYDPTIAKRILKEKSKAYCMAKLSEILHLVMGKGLIAGDEEICFFTAMIDLFSQATDGLCKKLDTGASAGEAVEMESIFSHLTLDIINKDVPNYDFDLLTNDTGIVEAVYVVLGETETRTTAPIPIWDIPIWKDVSPSRLKKVNVALKLINDTPDDMVAICNVKTGCITAFVVMLYIRW